ncbi:MAG TPA: 4-alpha-glucanotransferase, partial [Woeseiaceae bacterium]
MVGRLAHRRHRGVVEQSPLDRLCALHGIANEYYDIDGMLHRPSDHSRRRLLQAMGVDADNDDHLRRLLHVEEAERWRRRLDPVAARRDGESTLSLEFRMPEGERARPIRWRITEESGRIASGTLNPDDLPILQRREFDGLVWIRTSILIPSPTTTGYHRLQISEGSAPQNAIAECLVIVAPPRCYRPHAVAAGRRLWGLTAQLYGLRSQRNWGIGDFTDLLRLVEFAAETGAGFVGLNPLHSPLAHDNAHASPYDPSSRRFLNTLYLDVEAIPDFAESKEAVQLVADESFQAELRSLRGAELIDYQAVSALKDKLLDLLFRNFSDRHKDRDSERGRLFQAFQRDRGELLYRYAAFRVVYEYWSERDPAAWGWPAWPAEFHDCGSQAVAELVNERRARLDFFMYLQWNADLQLAAAAERATELGMPIGIYADLALSSKNGGADTWMDRSLYIRGAHIGAPPDDFNQAGQDWGLPPWHPARLRAEGYRPFIETLRANMRIGGAVRIDHVMSLMRCFLLPSGTGAAEGSYVHYAFDEMLAILALESQRHSCLVIGEDLGTVPDEVRKGLSETGVFGYRVLWFEKSEDGAFKAPAAFDTDVLTVISTHDLPTLLGFWQGADIEWRTQHELFPTAKDRERQLVMRAEDRARLLVALEKQQLLPEDADQAGLPIGAELTAGLRSAFHRYLARSASLLVGVQVEDLLGEREQANLPGTTSEHPNWRRRTSLQMESWSEEPQVLQLLSTMREERSAQEVQPPATETRQTRRAGIPRATYRVQLHQGFRFSDVEGLLPYLDALGISHVYCSPYLKARPGSKHGYDIVDHNALNPEIGDRAGFERFCDTLAARGMGQILDMVPNHMAVTGREHEWWLDVLENGPASRYADFFDIDWQPLKEELRGKVLLPVLGDHYGNVLDKGELKLVLDAEQGSFSVDYFEHRFPIDPREYPQVLEPGLDLLRARLPEDEPSLVIFESLITAFGNLPARACSEEERRHERARDQKLHQQRLSLLVAASPD